MKCGDALAVIDGRSSLHAVDALGHQSLHHRVVHRCVDALRKYPALDAEARPGLALARSVKVARAPPRRGQDCLPERVDGAVSANGGIDDSLWDKGFAVRPRSFRQRVGAAPEDLHVLLTGAGQGVFDATRSSQVDEHDLVGAVVGFDDGDVGAERDGEDGRRRRGRRCRGGRR